MNTHELAKSVVAVESTNREGENTQLVKVQGQAFCVSSPGAIHGYIIEEIEFALDDQIEAGQEPDLNEAVKTALATLKAHDMDWWNIRNVWKVF